MQTSTSSIRMFWNTVLRPWVVDIRRFGRYDVFVISKCLDPITYGRSVVPQNTWIFSILLSLRCLVELRLHLSEYLEVETALT
jgi:hypothetical protein